jgi:putative RNA 2'-phosphotransferase
MIESHRSHLTLKSISVIFDTRLSHSLSPIHFIQMAHAVTQASKFLSRILRHRPDIAQIELTSEGWASIADLEANTQTSRTPITREIIDEIQRTSTKVRFELSPDGTQIRALHGHSVDVELSYEAQTPPAVLYHGTARASLPSIRGQGLLPMRRKFVHLTTDSDDAREVGRRHGRPVLLTVAADQMSADGVVFYTPGNNIWLVDRVDTKYIAEAPPQVRNGRRGE